MSKRKMKLYKSSKNIVLAVITSVALILGAKTAYNQKFYHNEYELLTEEEIIQRNKLLEQNNKEEGEEGISPATIGYIAESAIFLISIGSGIYIYKNRDKNDFNYNNKSVIGSKVKESFKTVR